MNLYQRCVLGLVQGTGSSDFLHQHTCWIRAVDIDPADALPHWNEWTYWLRPLQQRAIFLIGEGANWQGAMTNFITIALLPYPPFEYAYTCQTKLRRNHRGRQHHSQRKVIQGCPIK